MILCDECDGKIVGISKDTHIYQPFRILDSIDWTLSDVQPGVLSNWECLNCGKEFSDEDLLEISSA